MSSPHLEVIPRIIDSSIAAAYQPLPKVSTEPVTKVASPDDGASKVAVVALPLTVTQKFFATIKDYMIPILFIISVIVIIYVLWKYWTKYRTNPDAIVAPASDTTAQEVMRIPGPTPSPIASADLSKYILSTDGSSEGDANSVHGKLSTIDEDTESHSSAEDETNSALSLESDAESDSDEESDSDDTDRDDADHESDVESIISEPDFSVISDLINQPIEAYASDRFEYLNDDNVSVANSIHTEIDTDETHMDDEGQRPSGSSDPYSLLAKPATKAPKRVKKTKRVVL